jgi:hypothetical protein
MFENEIDLSTKFSGSYELLKFILGKYKIYNGNLTKLVGSYNYKIYKYESGSSSTMVVWSKYGIPLRVWNLLYKDLTILSIQGTINFHSLEQLRNEHEQS